MAYTFHSVDRDQRFLLPPSLRDWLPADHLVWFVIDSVAQLDLRKFVRKSKKDDPRGRAALHPSMMLTLLERQPHTRPHHDRALSPEA